MPDQHTDSHDREHVARRRASSDSPSSDGPQGPDHPVLRLQNQVGNTQVARLLSQRQAAPGDEDIQSKHESVGTEGGAVGPDTSARIQSMRGSGSPLDSSTRGAMESAFGTRFGDVRVHANSESDQLNRRLTSHAFTTGNDIFLRSDASASDGHLMAHELSHVVQQRSMPVSGAGMHVGPAGDAHEQAADANADAFVSRSVVQREGEAPPEDDLQTSRDVAQRDGGEQEEDAN